MVKHSPLVRVEAQQHPFFEGMSGVTLTPILHRGGDVGRDKDLEGNWENTDVAFAAAEEAGAEYVEADVRCTADDKVVFFHGTNETKGIVAETRYADLNTPRMLRRLGMPEGSYVPLVGDTLAMFPKLKFFLDLKSDANPLLLADAIRRARAEHRVSFDGHKSKRAVAAAKELPGVPITINPIGLWALHSLAHRIPLRANGAKVKVPGLKTIERHFMQRATSLSIPGNRATLPLMQMAAELDVPVFFHNNKPDMQDVERAGRLGAYGVMIDQLKLLPNVGKVAIVDLLEPIVV